MATQLQPDHRLWSGCNFPLELQNKCSGGEQGSSDGEEEGSAGGGEYLEEGLASGVRRWSVKCQKPWQQG